MLTERLGRYACGPGTRYNVLGRISQNRIVSVTQTENGWACWTTAEGLSVWNSMAYLAPVDSAIAGQSRLTTVNLNLRTGPGVNYPIILTLPRGTAVTVPSVQNGWAKVDYQGAVGYVCTVYLR